MNITKDQAIAELAKRELARRGSLQESNKDKTILPTALSGMIGAQASSFQKEGITPALVGLGSGLTLGAFGSYLQNPKTFFQAGYSGAQMAAGEDLVNMFTGGKDRDQPLYAPQTVGGNVVMAGMEAVGNIKPTSILDDLYKTPGALERLQSAKAGKKARDYVSRLIPEIKQSDDIKANRQTGALVEGANLIKKTNNPIDVVNKFRMEKKSVIDNVNRIVAENNQPVDPNFIGSRARLILEKDLKNANPQEKKAIMKWVKEEGNWLDTQGKVGEFDTVKLNDRKRYLYEETAKLQEKQQKGQTIVSSPERLKVRDAFAQAYKEAIEKTHPDIAKLNARYAGLENGLTAASKMAERLIERGSLAERIATQTAGRPNLAGVGAAAVREIPEMFKSVGSQTGRIQKLSEKSANLLNKSRMKQAEKLLSSFMNKQKTNMSNSEFFSKVFSIEDANALSRIEDLRK